MQISVNQLVPHILTNKKLFSGIAIIIVILSHLIHVDPQTRLWGIFYPGFIGVDIFMFFSGYGLCRSFESNSLPQFYYHRFKRVYPIYIIFAIVSCLIYQWKESVSLPVADWLFAGSTLSFWGIGQVFVDWYLSFLICIYLLFPVLYFMIKKTGNWGIVISLCFIFSLLVWGELPWMLECSLSRIPVFLMGIACAILPHEQSYRNNCIAFAIAFVLSIALCWMGYIQKYVIVYMFAPMLMLMLAWIASKLSDQSAISKFVSFIGSISLEMYIANMLTLKILDGVSVPHWIALIYFALQTVLTVILVYINKGMSYSFQTIEHRPK